MKLFEVIFAVVLTALLILGLGLIAVGTGVKSVDRYLLPPEILPGLGTLYLCALLAAGAISMAKGPTSSFLWVRAEISKKIGESERKKLRSMFLVLTFLIVAFAMTPKASAMYQSLVRNYPVSLFANFLVSIIASAGLFGWLSSLFISKATKE